MATESLLGLWPDVPRKRRLPRNLKLALGGAGAFLVGVVAFGGKNTERAAAVIAPMDDPMVVRAEDLKNRREVRADDFRPRGAPAPLPRALPSEPGPTESLPTETLAERQARRKNDPDDVLTLRARRGTTQTTPGRGSSTVETAQSDPPVYVSAPALAASPAKANTASTGSEKTLATAGTSIPATLVSPVEVGGGSATVVARVDGAGGALHGARFIGSASGAGGRVVIRFRTVILSDGRQGRVDGEAQDPDGAFGLASGQRADRDDERGSVLGDVAEETATDLVSSAIGMDVAGRAVDRVVSDPRMRRTSGPADRAVSLPAGTKLQVFLHEAVTPGP